MPNPSNAVTAANLFSPVSASPQSAPRSTHSAWLLILALAASSPLLLPRISLAQDAPPPATAPAPAAAPSPAAASAFTMADLRPSLANVQNAVTALNVARWKVPGDVRSDTQQDVGSMQRDLSATLPGLLTAAEAPPGPNGDTALAPAFAVFRNLDALYDVLLRVSETASVGAPPVDARSLESARASLEDGRGRLGGWLLQAIGAQDAKLAQAAAAAARPQEAPPAPSKIIVDDGPENPKPRKKKATPPPAPQ